MDAGTMWPQTRLVANRCQQSGGPAREPGHQQATQGIAFAANDAQWTTNGWAWPRPPPRPAGVFSVVDGRLSSPA
jgi:hypothetical protein